MVSSWLEETKLMTNEIWNKFMTDKFIQVGYNNTPIELVNKEQLDSLNGEIIAIETKQGKDMLFCLTITKKNEKIGKENVEMDSYLIRPVSSENIAKVLGLEEESEDDKKVEFNRHLAKFPKLGIEVAGDGLVGSVVRMKDGSYATITSSAIYK